MGVVLIFSRTTHFHCDTTKGECCVVSHVFLALCIGGCLLLYMYITVHDYEDCNYFKLSMHCFTVLTQAVAFMPKTVCNIKEVEFARAVKLNKTSIDLIMFQVPRVKASILYYYYMASYLSGQDEPNPVL